MLVKLDTSTEEAQLAAAQADANLARLNYERAVEVRKGQANTPADLDAAEARDKQAQAAVATLEATIDKKSIRAPFDGRDRHPPGRARAGPRRRRPGRLAPVGDPDLRRVLAAAAGAGRASRSASRCALRTDTFPGADLGRAR